MRGVDWENVLPYPIVSAITGVFCLFLPTWWVVGLLVTIMHAHMWIAMDAVDEVQGDRTDSQKWARRWGIIISGLVVLSACSTWAIWGPSIIRA